MLVRDHQCVERQTEVTNSFALAGRTEEDKRFEDEPVVVE